MNRTSVKLLEAACEIAGGRSALARRLGIGETVLSLYMDEGRPLPDALLLRAVDLILAERPAIPPQGAEGPATLAKFG